MNHESINYFLWDCINCALMRSYHRPCVFFKLKFIPLVSNYQVAMVKTSSFLTAYAVIQITYILFVFKKSFVASGF